MPKRVLDVGQCDADHGSISRMLTTNFGDIQIDRSHLLADTMDVVRSQTYDLVLINRLLDRDHSEGTDVLKLMKADESLSSMPVMIVSNFADSQSAAVALGAEQGFGKSALNAPETTEVLSKFLAES